MTNETDVGIGTTIPGISVVTTSVAVDETVVDEQMDFEKPMAAFVSQSVPAVPVRTDEEKCVDYDKAWNELLQIFNQEVAFQTEIIDYTKSGLLVNINRLRGFIPASQIDLTAVEDLSAFKGQTLCLKIIEMDKEKKSIILSRRIILQEEKDRETKAAISRLEVGSIVEGVVSSLTSFGAFIQVGNIEGLAHVSEISLTHIHEPSAVLTVGQTVKAKVMSTNPEEGRLSLSIKEIMKDTWVQFVRNLTDDTVLIGTVKRIKDFGAFVEVAPGIEGLLYVAEISHLHVEKATDALSVGDVISVKVSEVSIENFRIGLSMRAAQKTPWEVHAEQLEVGTALEGTVKNIQSFGAFIELFPGIEGLLHISQVSHEHIIELSSVLEEGEKIMVKVIESNLDEKKISLSIKALHE